MAARKAVSTPALDTDVLVKLFQIVESFDSTEDNPTGTTEIADENGTTPTETFKFLEMLADAELIDSVGRGLNAEWFISVPDVSADNAEAIAREALANFTPEAPKPATKVRQTPKSSADLSERAQAAKLPEKVKDELTEGKPFKDAQDRAEFLDKVKDEPKPENTQTGLTREQVAKELKTVQVEIPQNAFDFDNIIAILKSGRENATNDPTNYEEPAECIPAARPDGVNENVWYMAHNSFGKSPRDTFSARLFWMERARDQFVA